MPILSHIHVSSVEFGLEIYNYKYSRFFIRTDKKIHNQHPINHSSIEFEMYITVDDIKTEKTSNNIFVLFTSFVYIFTVIN